MNIKKKWIKLQTIWQFYLRKKYLPANLQNGLQSQIAILIPKVVFYGV